MKRLLVKPLRFAARPSPSPSRGLAPLQSVERRRFLSSDPPTHALPLLLASRDRRWGLGPLQRALFSASSSSAPSSSADAVKLKVPVERESDSGLASFQKINVRPAASQGVASWARQLALRQDPPANTFTSEELYAETRRHVTEATSLPPVSYRSREYYRLETELIFGKAWFCAGHIQQIPQNGDTMTLKVGDEPILITNKNGEIHAFYNVCRHRGSKVVNQDGNYTKLRCPYHGWTYGLDGKLLTTPMFKSVDTDKATSKKTQQKQHQEEHACSGQCHDHAQQQDLDYVKNFRREENGLIPVRVDTWGPLIFLNLSGDALPLTDYLGDLPLLMKNYPFDEMVIVRSKTYDSRSNWKLLAENFLEYYHLPSVHPELCNVSGVDEHKRRQGTGMYVNFVTSPLTNGGTPIDADNGVPKFDNLSPGEQRTSYFPLIFPNMFSFLFPHHMFNVVLLPKNEEETVERADLLVHQSVLRSVPDIQRKIDDMWRFYDVTNIQDIEACEKVQEGIRVRAYKGGRMTYRFEEPVHRFQNMVINYMTGKPNHIIPGDFNAKTTPVSF